MKNSLLLLVLALPLWAMRPPAPPPVEPPAKVAAKKPTRQSGPLKGRPEKYVRNALWPSREVVGEKVFLLKNEINLVHQLNRVPYPSALHEKSNGSASSPSWDDLNWGLLILISFMFLLGGGFYSLIAWIVGWVFSWGIFALVGGILAILFCIFHIFLIHVFFDVDYSSLTQLRYG
jgi:hypothetical protein